MSAANCPFKIRLPKEDPDAKINKDKFVSFEVPIDPANPNGLTVTQKFKILDSSDVEEVLFFWSRLDDLILTLNIPQGIPHFRLMPALLGHDNKKHWGEIVQHLAPQAANQVQATFERCVEEFLLVYMDRDISLDIKEWIRQVKKPRDMEVTEFVEQIRHCNNLIEYCPDPDPNNPGVATPILTEPELAVVLCNSCLKHWTKAQVQANLKNLSLNQQTAYFTGLKKMEATEESHNNHNRPIRQGQHMNQNRNRNSNNINRNRNNNNNNNHYNDNRYNSGRYQNNQRRFNNNNNNNNNNNRNNYGRYNNNNNNNNFCENNNSQNDN